MEKDLNKLEKIWSYRIVDASFCVHSRLYKLHESMHHLEKTMFTLLKNNIVTTPVVILTTLSYLTALYIQVSGVKISWEFLKPLIVIGLFLIVIFILQINEARNIQKELAATESEIKGERLETWPDYLFDEASKWATRISMAKEVLDENENIPTNERDESYESTRRNFIFIINSSINLLIQIKKNCKKLPKEQKDLCINIQNICDNSIIKGEATVNKYTR